MGQLGKETPSDSSRSELSSVAENSQQTRSEELNQTVTNQQSATNTAASDQPETPKQLVVISGGWTLELNGSTPSMASLAIFQNGDAVYGTGNINQDANTTVTAAASGTATGNNVNLNMVSSGKVRFYRVVLIVNGDSATGSYTAFSPNVGSTTDTINGVRAVPLS